MTDWSTLHEEQMGTLIHLFSILQLWEQEKKGWENARSSVLLEVYERHGQCHMNVENESAELMSCAERQGIALRKEGRTKCTEKGLHSAVRLSISSSGLSHSDHSFFFSFFFLLFFSFLFFPFLSFFFAVQFLFNTSALLHSPAKTRPNFLP